MKTFHLFYHSSQQGSTAHEYVASGLDLGELRARAKADMVDSLSVGPEEPSGLADRVTVANLADLRRELARDRIAVAVSYTDEDQNTFDYTIFA